jgi:hypothetical protein
MRAGGVKKVPQKPPHTVQVDHRGIEDSDIEDVNPFDEPFPRKTITDEKVTQYNKNAKRDRSRQNAVCLAFVIT